MDPGLTGFLKSGAVDPEPGTGSRFDKNGVNCICVFRVEVRRRAGTSMLWPSEIGVQIEIGTEQSTPIPLQVDIIAERYQYAFQTGMKAGCPTGLVGIEDAVRMTNYDGGSNGLG